MCPTKPQTLDPNLFPSVLLWWTLYTSSYFLLIYIFHIYALQKQTNLEVLQALKKESFSEEKLHQEAEWNMKKRRYENTRCGSANRRTKAELSFALFTVPGYLISLLSFSVNALYSKSTLDAEGKQDLKLSTNMETGTLNARLDTYSQDGKYKWSTEVYWSVQPEENTSQLLHS